MNVFPGRSLGESYEAQISSLLTRAVDRVNPVKSKRLEAPESLSG